MNHRDIMEIRKRFKKDGCSITRLCGCYVNSEKKIITSYSESFLNMEEDEFFKYLEIAKKVLSGSLGNNLLELAFRREETRGDGRQNFLMRVKGSRLKDVQLVEELYQSIIDHFNYEGNYLILVFSDTYDILKRTTDNLKLDESEETYEYMIAAICPVALSKPGLHYEADEQKMKARPMDWLVEAPIHGFLFPAFTDRSSDVNSVLYYTKNPREPHGELMEEVLGCTPMKTSALHQESLHSMFLEAAGFEVEKAEVLFLEFQENLNGMVENQAEIEDEPILLSADTVQDLLEPSHASEEVIRKINEVYEGYFGDEIPQADRMVIPSALKSAQKLKKEQALEKQVENLLSELEAYREESSADKQAENEAGDQTLSTETVDGSLSDKALDLPEEFDVLLKVRPEKRHRIRKETINGETCILIPLEEDEKAFVDGEDGEIEPVL